MNSPAATEVDKLGLFHCTGLFNRALAHPTSRFRPPMKQTPGVYLEIEELGPSRIVRGGWPRLRRVLATTLKSAIGWTVFATLLAGLGGGWQRIPQNTDRILFFTFLGVVLGVCDHLLRSLWVVIGEEEITIREGSSSYSTISKHPRSAVKALCIRCWQKRHFLTGIRWHAALEIHWLDEDQPDLDIRGTAVGVERSAERLAELYPVVEQDIPPPRPGTSERERAERERAEIAQLRQKGVGYVCWRCGILPVTATAMVGFPLLMSFLGGWPDALVGLFLSLIVGPVFGFIGGLMGWAVLEKKSEILDREWPAEFSRIERDSPDDRPGPL